MGLKHYITVLTARWIVVVGAVVCAIAAAWLTVSVTPIAQAPQTYTASTVLFYTPQQGGLSLTTIATFGTIETVAKKAAQQVGYTGPPLTLAEKVALSPDDASQTLTITATSTNGKDAATLAEAWTGSLTSYLEQRNATAASVSAAAYQTLINRNQKRVQDLQNRIKGESADAAQFDQTALNGLLQQVTQETTLQRSILDQAQLPIGLEKVQDATPVATSSSGFQPPRSRGARLGIAGILGIILGVGLALLIEFLSSPIRTRQTAELRYGLPVIGEIPPFPRGRRNRLITQSRPRSPAAQSFRLLAASSSVFARQRSDRRRASNIVLVTSATTNEGKSTVASNLAAANAEIGKSVVVVSCDFYRPTIHEVFGVHPVPGLAEFLDGSHGLKLDDILQRTAVAGVDLIASGALPTRPSELLASPSMRQLLDELCQRADLVIIDTPPLLATGDAVQLIPVVDQVLVVVREGKTKADLAEHAAFVLKRVGSRAAALVLTESAEATMPTRYQNDAQWKGPSVAEPQPTGNGQVATPNGRPIPDEGDQPAGRGVIPDGGGTEGGDTL